MLRFDGKVTVITGAGGGLGKAYALFFASRGALVVVNDLSDGSANLVVQEIIKSGGKAIANYDSVENGDRIIQTALKSFGRVDIVINNAGILRDKSFSRMSDAEWDLVLAVHLKGSYNVTKAAWDHMLKQGFGRIINTASAAGIYGNFGQANYSAAKLALLGFSNSLAMEGAKKNVFCNTIAPLAASKMTETIMPPDILASLKPEFVVPLVAYLCHETCSENGSLFEVGAGFVSKLRRERSKGALFRADKSFTPESVADQFTRICDFRDPDYPKAITDTDWMGLLQKSASCPSVSLPMKLDFTGRVAVVTGAGNGLGRAYALLFAKYGASVVVNDLGGSINGAGGESSAADKVVAEIIALKGKAVANYNSVEDGEKIIETAIKTYGRVDIVVNNAGILRDKSFSKMTDLDWDLVLRVHLRGSYKVARAAWPYMLQQKYGRIINTSSCVGLYGNFGQTNYSAAKAALIAFSNTLAIEGSKSNIIVNTVAPNAGTRMTATIMPPEMIEALKPEYIAPLVVFLCHESNNNTGGIYEAGSGWIAKVRWQRTVGYGFPVNKALLPEDIVAKWNEITNFKNSTYPQTTQESFAAIQANFGNVQGQSLKPNSPQIDVEAAKKLSFVESSTPYTYKDVILYNLGLGAKRTDLNFVNENNSNFRALPTFGVIWALNYQTSHIDFARFLPGFNPMMLLHGEQYLEIHRPFPVNGKVVQKGEVVEILDKGKAASVVMKVTSRSEQGDLLSISESTMFIRGIGGFGGPKSSDRGDSTRTNEPPNRPPDFVVIEKTNAEQAALYRLSGDFNPLHIDPEMSSMGGFKVPILHGLCTFGIAGKHILEKYGDFKNIKARFSKHVFPGETLETNMWKEGDRVVFIVKVVERNEIAISNAAVVLKKPESTSQANASAGPAFASSAIFTGIQAGLDNLPGAERSALVKKTDAIFAFEVNNGKETSHWYVDLKNGNGSVGNGPAKANMTVQISDTDLVQLGKGALNPQKAFMTGKIKIKGNMGLASKLEGVLKLAAAPKAKL